jgi:hypothetical protein
MCDGNRFGGVAELRPTDKQISISLSAWRLDWPTTQRNIDRHSRIPRTRCSPQQNRQGANRSIGPSTASSAVAREYRRIDLARGDRQREPSAISRKYRIHAIVPYRRRFPSASPRALVHREHRGGHRRLDVLTFCGAAAVLLQDGDHGNHVLQLSIDFGVAAGVVPRLGKRFAEMILNDPRQGGIGLHSG